MPIRVVVTDLASGESETRDIRDGDYVCIAVAPCYLSHHQVYPTKGTHILTIKGHAPQEAAPSPAADTGGQAP